MPFSSGNYSAPSSPGSFNPAISGQPATASSWNTLLADIATALSTAILKDGTQTITQNIPFNNKKITGLGNATLVGDALNAGQVVSGALTGAADTGAADAYVIAPPIPIAAYARYQRFSFIAEHANTGASTLAVSGLPAKVIAHLDGTALVAGDIPLFTVVDVEYDGARFVLMTATGLRGMANTWLAGQTFATAITYGGVTLSNAVTGVGKMVLEAGPVLSGADLGTGSFALTQGVGTDNHLVATCAFANAAANASPSSTKVWGFIQADTTVLAGWNIASVTSLATGSYRVNFITPFSSTLFATVATAESSFGTAIVAQTANRLVSSVDVIIQIGSTNVAVDSAFCLSCFGNQ